MKYTRIDLHYVLRKLTVLNCMDKANFMTLFFLH